MQCPFRSLSTLFGEPGKGVHAPRFLGLAAFDLAGTALLAAAAAAHWHLPLWQPLLGLLVLGEALHALCCVRTPVVLALGLLPS